MNEHEQIEGKAAAAADSEPSRALVPLAPPAEGTRALSAPRPSLFIAQLIASREQHPQMRERRRAEPETAMHAYAMRQSPYPHSNGCLISRAM